MRAYLEHVEKEARERDAFRGHIEPLEDKRYTVYLDSMGYPTVGIGHKVTRADGLKLGDRVTDAQIDAFWQGDADRALKSAKTQMQAAGITDESFLAPLASVNFQLGDGWYKEHKDTWALITARQYAAAAREAQNSDWFKQTPRRVRAFQQALIQLEQAEQTRRSRQRNNGARRP